MYKFIKNSYSDEILEIYKKNKSLYKKRLKDFKDIWEKGTNEDIHCELSFCILTPQSKALNAWSAIEKLRDTKVLYEGSPEDISEFLNVVRFKNNKSRYLVELREKMKDDKGNIITKDFFANFKNNDERRNWIIKNIKGMSYKEAGHFLRNVGFGSDIAILDRHILRNLVRLGVIEEIPKSLSPKKYLEIEDRLKAYTAFIGIPMDEMDLLLWHKEAGTIFK